MDASVVVTESAVDWITATGHGKFGVRALQTMADAFVDAEQARGNVVRDFDLYGYRGNHCGRCSYGRMGDRFLLQLSAELAADYALSVLPVAGRVTRLDLQVTARLSPVAGDVAALAYQARPTSRVGRYAMPRYTLYQNDGGGETLYVGSPSSASRGRCYNKHAESGLEHYAGCWRWEVQLRETWAIQAAGLLPYSDDIPALVLGYVHGWFRDRGAPPPFGITVPYHPEVPPRAKTDTDRKLLWLRRAVRPSCEFLCDNGMTEEALDALGLTWLLDATSVPGALPGGEPIVGDTLAEVSPDGINC